MNIRSDKIIKSMLGEDFFEVLEKSDVYKMYNRSVTGIDEMSTGLKIVPRAVMSFLVSCLSNMDNDQNKDIELPFAPNCNMQITKKDRDTFQGYIYSNGKKINEFKNRSIPGIGLVLMTTFELYDTDKFTNLREQEKESFDVSKLQNMIDERFKLHSLICSVVDQKIAQRDAIETLIKEKIKSAIYENSSYKEEKEEEESSKYIKSDKLRDFLLRQKKKRTEEYQIEKREEIHCPDCGSQLYDGGKNLALCICYGEDWNKKIKIQKNEDKIKMNFPKSIDTENIEMLLKTLKSINKE